MRGRREETAERDDKWGGGGVIEDGGIKRQGERGGGRKGERIRERQKGERGREREG